MSDLIVYVDQSSVLAGKLDELKPAMEELVDFVEENEPDILAYNVYFSPDENRMTVVHMHSGPASLDTHMEVAGPLFPPIGKFIELEAIDVYGQPSEELVAQLREKASTLGSGRVTIHQLQRGLERITAEASA